MKKVFISYSHSEHKELKDKIANYINSLQGFSDHSVEVGDISEDLSDETIRRKIRDEYLRETTVTIVICGNNAKHRKHIDWEIHSSMYDGQVNKKSGIVVIDTLGSHIRTSSNEIKQTYANDWVTLSSSDVRNRFSHLPERIVDNLVKDGVNITVLPISDLYENNDRLIKAINFAHDNRSNQQYDLSKSMRRRNNDSKTIKS